MRIKAIDVFRALTMVMMLWVNDFAGLEGIPHWLKHAARGEDMLGFSDVVFPAFLFVMGVSVPLAIRNRRAKGDGWLRIVWHVVLRTVALVVMGLMTVNYESLDAGATGLARPWFCLLMTAAFFLIWAVYPRAANNIKRALFAAMKCVGVGILVWLYTIYVGRGGSEFGVRWWGILGLIGWSYAVSCVTYIFVGNRLVLSILAWLAVVGASLLWGGNFTLWAFSVSGVLTASLMSNPLIRANQQNENVDKRVFVGVLWMLGLVMFGAGALAHGEWIISKIGSTPTWFFYCMTAIWPLFAVVYSLTEVKGKAHWFKVIAPAGTVTLTCYILPYVWYSVRSLAGVGRPEVFHSGLVGLVGSLIFALVIVWIAGLLNKYLHVRLKI